MQHLTPDLAFCHFRQGRHYLPNSRYTTGILFSTRFYSTWSLCVQCVEYGCVWMCVCLMCSSAVKTTHRLSAKKATAGLRAGHQAPRFSFWCLIWPSYLRMTREFQLFLALLTLTWAIHWGTGRSWEGLYQPHQNNFSGSWLPAVLGHGVKNKCYVQSFPEWGRKEQAIQDVHQQSRLPLSQLRLWATREQRQGGEVGVP